LCFPLTKSGASFSQLLEDVATAVILLVSDEITNVISVLQQLINTLLIIIIITDLYSAFRSEDTEALFCYLSCPAIARKMLFLDACVYCLFDCTLQAVAGHGARFAVHYITCYCYCHLLKAVYFEFMTSFYPVVLAAV